ncbi:MAG: hypothetical protein H6641_05600 [Caldilineaceae bacterium]|nr:hypothetical protein [Caldilineaceae bacterium]
MRKFEPLQALGHRIYGKIDQLLHISLSELDNIRELLSIVAFFDGLINLADSVYLDERELAIATDKSGH